MAQITFKSTIPDATLEKIATVHGYKNTIPNPAYVSAEETPNETETIANPETAINFAALHVLGRACAEVGVHESTFPDKDDMTPKQYEAKKVEIRTEIYTTTIVEVNDIKIN